MREETLLEQSSDIDLSFAGPDRSARIVKEGGLTRVKHTYDVSNAMAAVKQMNRQAREGGVKKGAETRCRFVLHEGMIQQIADKHGITPAQLLYDSNYDDLLWKEAEMNYSKMKVVE